MIRFQSALLFALALAPILHAVPVTAVEFSVLSGGSGGGQVNYTQGYQFRADQNLLLTDLGIYDQSADGLMSPHQVGLYEVTSGGLVLQRSASFSAGTPGDLENSFRYLDVADYTLVAGTSYVLAASNHYMYPVDNGAMALVSNVTYNGITYQGGRWGYSEIPGDALSTPTIQYNVPGQMWYLTANFHYDDGTPSPGAVPEPSTAALALLGVGLLAARIRGRRA